ncbi:MAG: aminotransferase class III-fold pyridoxal phosphate-dependent enzyme [Candidatus Margulisiibacteriota bacterium]
MGKSQDLYKKAKQIIPGGTQLLSKRPEMFLPDRWPAYYERAAGCEVWDLDGNKYIDMSYMGIGACVLGYADPDVNKAVKQAVDKGSMTTLNCPEEVELAELLCDLHPWAGMVRYVRTGGEALAVAVRIARARTGKDLILFCGYHGWHDWYLSANLADDQALDGHLIAGLSPKGVPRGLIGTAKPFIYNDIKGFRSLMEKHKGKIAAVVVETIRNYEPKDGFLDEIRQATKQAGVVMICDEVSSGWRLNLGGAHLLYGLKPDLAVFGKALGNGFPIGAVIGTGDAMSAAQETFISSTYWTERVGPTAAIATIKKMKEKNVPEHLVKTGKEVQAGWAEKAQKHGLKVTVSGIAPLGHFSFDYDNHLALKTLFTQVMLDKGYLACNAFYSSYAHKPEHVAGYFKAADESFAFIAQAVKDKRVEACLKGPVCHAGFRRLE